MGLGINYRSQEPAENQLACKLEPRIENESDLRSDTDLLEATPR
jgi:hypothetical protein